MLAEESSMVRLKTAGPGNGAGNPDAARAKRFPTDEAGESAVEQIAAPPQTGENGLQLDTAPAGGDDVKIVWHGNRIARVVFSSGKTVEFTL